MRGSLLDEEHVSVEIDTILAETDRAWLVRSPDLKEDDWFPKSQCEIEEGNSYIAVPIWLAERKGVV